MSITEIIALILSAFSTLGLTAGGLWLRRENKRKANAEAVQVETNNAILASHEWKSIAENREEKLIAKDKKIEELYLAMDESRKVYNQKVVENSELCIELASQKPRVCNRPGCRDREPQSGF